MIPPRALLCFGTILVLALAACRSANEPSPPLNVEEYIAQIQEYRRQRDRFFISDPFSQLALVHREYLEDGRRVTLGSSRAAGVTLPGDGVFPLHAAIEGVPQAPLLQAQGTATFWTPDDPRATTLVLQDETGFRIGRYNLRYIVHGVWGPTLEIYDPEQPSVTEFTGMEYFPVDLAYRVRAEVVRHRNPERLNLIDSHGNPRPYFLYGELRFELQSTLLTLEIYSTSTTAEQIKEHGFQLMFTDATSGKESYPASRYLDVEGKAAGTITVDFNRAYSPPCNYSPVFTCPFPRPQNRLSVPVRAGQKRYRGAPARALGSGS